MYIYIYICYDKKVVTCHPLCCNLEIWKLLVILVIIKLFTGIDIFKYSN